MEFKRADETIRRPFSIGAERDVGGERMAVHCDEGEVREKIDVRGLCWSSS